MLPSTNAADGAVIDLEDGRPIAARRKRRSNTGPNEQRDSQMESVNSRTSGMATPPATPHRTKKRVRFSDPGSPSTTGLTPFLCRNSISSPPPSKSRRFSTPSARWNLSVDDSPVLCGTLQFAPLRSVLEGRVKRRLCRNRLSEEVHIIEKEEREKKKSQKMEIERLKQELEELRNERELASQIDREAGTEMRDTSHIDEQVAKLRAELETREADVPADDGPNWTTIARDPFNEVDTFMPAYDDEFNNEMTDVFMSTPGRGSFPSPPATAPNTPSKPTSQIDVSNDSAAIGTENVHLQSQLKTLQDEIKVLSKALEITNTTQERLTSKLSPFMLGTATQLEEVDSVDSALDAVLTQLALSQSAAVESTSRFSVLADELATLFPASSPQDPESILEELQKQFRVARLELEYLAPGENPEGFDNLRLLDMLVSRLQTLTKKVEQQDLDIDQYHCQETSLRKQLGSRVDAMAELQTTLLNTESKAIALGSELHDRDNSISKLTNALQGYRDEVAGLESLVTRLEVDHAADLASLRDEAESTNRDSELKCETLQAAAEGREMLMVELETRLSAAHTASQTLEDEIAEVHRERASAIAKMQQSAQEQEKQHGDALALRDARVIELREEVDRINTSLDEAHKTITGLERVKWSLVAQFGEMQQSAQERENQQSNALALRDAREKELREEVDRINASLKIAHDTITGLDREKLSLVAQFGKMQQSAQEREKQHGDALALRDARVIELREEVDRINASLKSAHNTITVLDREKRGFLAQFRKKAINEKTITDTIRGHLTFLDTIFTPDIVLDRDEGCEGGSSRISATPLAMVSQKVIRHGGLFDAQSAKKPGVGNGKKRRLYDSGMGYLAEEEEDLGQVDDLSAGL